MPAPHRLTPAYAGLGLAALASIWSTPMAAQTPSGLPQSMPLAQPTAPMVTAPSGPGTPNAPNNRATQSDVPPDLGLGNLTPDQVAQLDAIFATYQPQIEAATIAYGEALTVLNDRLVPATTDDALTQARNQAVAAKRALDDLVYARNLALRSVLTLEQRQAINDSLRAWLGLAPVNPVAVFPQTLVGMPVEAAIAQLQADGWSLVVETPGLMGLDRNNQQLDLDVGRDGQIATATLR